MKTVKDYRCGFDIWGCILFLIIMIPNFIWFAIPAPNDVLRGESLTRAADIIASVAQVIMVTSLCFIINTRRSERLAKGYKISIIALVLLYMTGWIMYYMGLVNSIVMLNLTIAPSMAFNLFSIGRKNIFAIVSASVFTICHIVFCLVNFIL